MLHWFWGWGNNGDTSPKQLEHVDFSKAFKNQVSTYDHDHKHTEMPIPPPQWGNLQASKPLHVAIMKNVQQIVKKTPTSNKIITS